MGLHFWPKGGSVYPGGGYNPTLVYQKFPYGRGRGWSMSSKGFFWTCQVVQC